jgi:hypothetical protein
MPSLAICFYGQPRFLDNEYVYSCYSNIKEQYNADIFIHSWISETESKMDASDWALSYNLVEKQDSAKQLLKMYSPKKHIFEKPRKFSLSNSSREKVKNLSYYSENNENNLLSHLTSFWNVVNLVESQQYDFLLVTRFDAFLENFPNLSELDSNKFYLFGKNHSHWTDITFVCGNKYHAAFNAIDYIDEISEKVPLFTAEEYKKQAYLKQFNLSDVVWLKTYGNGLVRSNNNLESVQN